MKIKLSLLMIVASIVLGGVILSMAIFAAPLLSQYAAFLSFLLLLFILGIIFAKFEESKISSKEVALIGILGAITAASRIPFAALPNIMPCTFLIIVTGLVFGALAGAMVGSMTAAVSNMFFGQGPWTPWMMVAWSMVGIVSGYMGKRYPNFGVRDIVLLGIVLGMAYTELMDFSSWLVFYRADPNYLIPTFAAGLPFGALHITGNVIFAVVLGKPVLTLFKRFQQRFHVTYDADRPPQIV
jgi:energy-coupling factor transport system substrate-specific component